MPADLASGRSAGTVVLAAVLACLLPAGGPARAMPDPVYEYEAALLAFMVAQHCGLDDAAVTAGFSDASIFFMAGEYLGRDAAAAMREAARARLREEWQVLPAARLHEACRTRGSALAARLRGRLSVP